MPETPGAKPAASNSAGSAIRARIAILTGVLSKIEEGPREPQALLVHKLRVSTRRLTVTMKVLFSSLPRDGKRLQRGAKELRRAAGALRDADVHTQLLSRTLREAQSQETYREVPSRSAAAIADALALISEDRRQASTQLRRVIARVSSKKIQQWSKSFAKHVDDTSDSLQARNESLRRKSLARAFDVLRRVDVAAKGDLSHPPSLHKLRLSLKSLRYARESLAMVDPTFKADTTQTAKMQEQLGDINDISTLTDRLSAYVRMIDSQHSTEVLASTRRLRNGLESLKSIFQTILERRCAAFAMWWLQTYPDGASGLFAPELAALAQDPSTHPAWALTDDPASGQTANATTSSNLFPSNLTPSSTSSAPLPEITVCIPPRVANHTQESRSLMHKDTTDSSLAGRNARRTISHPTHHQDAAAKPHIAPEAPTEVHREGFSHTSTRKHAKVAPSRAEHAQEHINLVPIESRSTRHQIYQSIFPYHKINSHKGLETGEAGLWIAGHRIAVIDIGSNSIRLLVVEMIDDRTWTTLAQDRAMTRLAHGLVSEANLSEEAMKRSLDAIGRFKAIALQHGVSPVRAFATAAVRTAANGPAFLQKVKATWDIDVEIISGHLEGQYTYQSVARIIDLSKADACVADMGGGSLEVVSSKHGVITSVSTMPLGAVRISEKYPDADVSDDSFVAMRREISRTISENVPRRKRAPHILVGCGGTFTTIATLAAASRDDGCVGANGGNGSDGRQEGGATHSSALNTTAPMVISREEIRSFIKHIRRLTPEERSRVPGLPADRGDIVLAGLLGVERLMKRLKTEELLVHFGGMREGLILKLAKDHLEKHQSKQDLSGPIIVQRARELAHAADFEWAHCEHVAKLSVAIYDLLLTHKDLVRGLGTMPYERALLEAAAVLHDIGTIVSYSGHHKHSAAIVRVNGLGEVPAHMVELISQICRYHRKAGPKTKHRAFATLIAQEQDMVTRLSGILRIADGLDRSHTQEVDGISASVGKRSIRLTIHGHGDMGDNHDAAMEKADVLEKYTGLKVDVIVESLTPDNSVGSA